MAKKNTVAALRIKQEMKAKSINGTDLASLANIPYSAVANILAGKSSKIEKLEAIAKSLGKPLMYFVDVDYGDKKIDKGDEVIYDGELHYKVVKIINDLCKKKAVHLTKEKMDKLVNFIYPRLKKDDPQDLIKSQTEALLDYALKH
jgi:transcriptional regulator with XRE-family HTH domain